MRRRSNARFSTSFDDQQVKNSLVKTHSIYRKMRKESDVSAAEEEKGPANNEGQTSSKRASKEKNNDDSLDTQEDLDNYLE